MTLDFLPVCRPDIPPGTTTIKANMCWDLCVAIIHGNLKRTRKLLDQGSSIHNEETNDDYEGWTPLQFAHHSVEITQL